MLCCISVIWGFVDSDCGGMNFSFSRLEDVDFEGCNIDRGDFHDSMLYLCEFCESTSESGVLRKTSVVDGNFDGIELAGERLEMSEVDLTRASFVDAVLSNASFLNCNLREVIFTGTDLTFVSLKGSDLTGVNLSTALSTAYIELEDVTSLDLATINWQTFMEGNDEIALPQDYYPAMQSRRAGYQAMQETQRKEKAERAAAGIFLAGQYFIEGYVVPNLNPNSENAEAKAKAVRYLEIQRRLPVELQMRLANVAVGLNKDFIRNTAIADGDQHRALANLGQQHNEAS